MTTAFVDVPKFLRAQLQQDWGYVKHGQPAQQRERQIQADMDTFCRETEFRATRQLRHFLESLGLVKCREIAKYNLTYHYFARACVKAMETK